MSVFSRHKNHTFTRGVSVSNFISAVGHLFIPILTYKIMYDGMGHEWIAKMTPNGEIIPLSDDRKALYLFLNSYYAIRWCFGMLTMNTTTSPSGAFMVVLVHIVVHELQYVVGSMGGFWTSHALTNGYHVTTKDYVAAALMILAGILQHGSEAQRWWFKRNPNNRGKLHTSGLFGLARGINHTGHVLRDMAAILMMPNLVCFCFYAGSSSALWFRIYPETIEHMKTKYGEKYEEYAKKTPYLFIPWIY